MKCIENLGIEVGGRMLFTLQEELSRILLGLKVKHDLCPGCALMAFELVLLTVFKDLPGRNAITVEEALRIVMASIARVYGGEVHFLSSGDGDGDGDEETVH